DDVALAGARPEAPEDVGAEQAAIRDRCDAERQLDDGRVLVAKRDRARDEHRRPHQGEPAPDPQEMRRQANAATMPRLKDGGSKVTFQASNQAVVSAGPNLAQARPHVVAGKFGSPTVTLEIATPRKESIVAIHAAAHVQSSTPPSPDVQYRI